MVPIRVELAQELQALLDEARLHLRTVRQVPAEDDVGDGPYIGYLDRLAIPSGVRRRRRI